MRRWPSGSGRPRRFTDADAGIHTAILKIRQALRRLPGCAAIRGNGVRQGLSVRRTGRGHRHARTSISASAGLRPASAVTGVTTCQPKSPASSGRETDLLEVPRMLATSRLVSLTGAGGVGKTRLAVRVAAGLVHDFADGVWLIDLASLTVPDLLAQTVATTLDIREGAQRSARDVLLDALHERDLLLVLDTCEHLIESCAARRRSAAARARGPNPRDQPRGAGGPWRDDLPRCLAGRPGSAAEGRPARRVGRDASLRRTRARVNPDFGYTPATPSRSLASVAGSTAFRWRSSWRPLVSSCSRPSRSKHAWTIDSGCSRAVRERPSPASGRSKPPSTGAVSCCRTSSGCC